MIKHGPGVFHHLQKMYEILEETRNTFYGTTAFTMSTAVVTVWINTLCAETTLHYVSMQHEATELEEVTCEKLCELSITYRLYTVTNTTLQHKCNENSFNSRCICADV